MKPQSLSEGEKEDMLLHMWFPQTSILTADTKNFSKYHSKKIW